MANEDQAIGTTVSWGTSGFTAAITDMSIGGIEVAQIPKTNYGSTTWKEYIFGKLKDTPEMTISINYDTSQLLAPVGTTETITITYPIPPGLSTAATIVGTGATTGQESEMGDADGDDLMTAQLTIKFDGGTGPTFTDAA